MQKKRKSKELGVELGNSGVAAKPISLRPLKLQDVLRAALDTPAIPFEAEKPKPKKRKVAVKKSKKK